MNYRWDIFLSYASEDRETFARPLQEALSQRGLKVWFDQNEIEIGDDLHEKVTHGLAESQFGVIIVSKSFLSKNWPAKELQALSSLEAGPNKKLLPVWHEIDPGELAKIAPLLARKVGIETHTGVDNVCERIVRAIRAEHRRQNPPPSTESIANSSHLDARQRASSVIEPTSEWSASLKHFGALSQLMVLPGVYYVDPVHQGRFIPKPTEIAYGLAAMRHVIESLLRRHRRGSFLLVGVNRGGWTLANFFAERLGLSRSHLLRYDFLTKWQMSLVEPRPGISDVQLVIAVDDIARTGRTMRAMRLLLRRNFPLSRVFSLSLNVRPEALEANIRAEDEDSTTVDFSPIIANVPHPALPWNVGATSDVFAYIDEADIKHAEARWRS